ncbi:MAG TPA: hypothetical protein VM841_01720 [Actinomycetota bacterium]|nr:hypothetical protein [Actinomycetota bacterium]
MTHRMADAFVRTRVALMLVVMTALAWTVVTLMGRGTGPYRAGELPDLAGLPILVPQIERLAPPRDLMPGAPAPAPPPEGSP